MIKVDELPIEARPSVVTVNLLSNSLHNLYNLPNLRTLMLELNPGENIPEQLCNPQLMPKLNFIINNFHFSSNTKTTFKNFMEVNGCRVKRLFVFVHKEVSRFVKILAKATNLVLCTINFDTQCKELLDYNDAKILSHMYVACYIVIEANSKARRKNFNKLFGTGSKPVLGETCRIISLEEFFLEPIDPDEDDDTSSDED